MPHGNDVRMKSVNGHHVYEGDGKTYPSVTTVLQCIAYTKHIVEWANWLGMQHLSYEKTLNATAIEGTLAHAHAQHLVDPENGPMPEKADPLTDYYVQCRMKFFVERLEQYKGRWKTIYTEHPLLSHTYKIGGTMDWFAEWDGKPTLFDFKTSKGVRDKHLLQLGGYKLMLEDNNIPVEQAGIIVIGRDFCRWSLFTKEEVDKFAEWFKLVYDYYWIHEELEKMTVDTSVPYIDR